MADSRPNSEPEKNPPPPIDPDVAAAAVQELNDAIAILPKKRLGCLGRFTRYGAVLLVLLVVFVYWNFLRTPPLRISKETTYITEPLTSDGKRVDYFAAMEKLRYPPEMKTDDNGYRLIIRALGDATNDGRSAVASAQVYEKLGLDPAIEPTMTFVETYPFFQEYCATQGLAEEQAARLAAELEAKVYHPWTLDELPMLKPWLEKNGPVLDLGGEAVRRPTFCSPLVRIEKDATLVEMTAAALSELQRTRQFARMLSARAYYRIGIGDIDGAIDDMTTCERLGRDMESRGTLVERLVGLAIEGIVASIGVAAIRESQPTKEQLQRLVDELNAIPPRSGMDKTQLTERYYMLDWLQAMAMDNGSLASLFSAFESIKEFKPGIAAHLSVDWNIVMRRVSALMDDWDSRRQLQPPSLWSPTNLFIGARSRRVADLIAGLSIPSFQATREADRRTTCGSNLQRITLAMLIYEREHGTLPPAYAVGADGKPLHSWRVLLLPYLGQEELYGKLRLDEPWDSQHNRQFHDAAVAVYQCPSAWLGLGQTTYSVVVGEKTAFQAGEGKSLDDLGMNLMLVVERQQAVCWMDPTSELVEAIAVDGINGKERPAAGFGSRHPGGMDVGCRDGSSRFISETLGQFSLQGLLDGTADKYP